MTTLTAGNRAVAAAVAGMLALGLVGNEAAAQQSPAGIDALIRNFDRMAFGEDPRLPEFVTLERWTGPVRAVLLGDGAAENAPAVRALFTEFEALTGLEFTLAEADAGARLEVFFSDRAWYTDAVAMRFGDPERVQCFSNTASTEGRIGRAFAAIPADLRPAEVQACLGHELMHTLGFKGHPDRSLASALRNGRATGAVTINDRILIRTLYDDRLVPGMPREQALRVAREVIEELLHRLGEKDDPAVLNRRRPVQWWRADQFGA